MEQEQINQNNEITLVKKGVFYYLFLCIAFPFKIIFWIFKKIFKYLKIYLGWFKEYQIHEEKKKNLNRILSIKNPDEEII